MKYISLDRHIYQIHKPNEQRHECGTCGKKFYNETALRNHVDEVHIRERKFVCQFCAEGFCSKEGLTKHINLKHKRVRPRRQCPYCEKDYSDIKNLKKHVKSHHGDRLEEFLSAWKAVGVTKTVDGDVVRLEPHQVRESHSNFCSVVAPPSQG